LDPLDPEDQSETPVFKEKLDNVVSLDYQECPDPSDPKDPKEIVVIPETQDHQEWVSWDLQV